MTTDYHTREAQKSPTSQKTECNIQCINFWQLEPILNAKPRFTGLTLLHTCQVIALTETEQKPRYQQRNNTQEYAKYSSFCGKIVHFWKNDYTMDSIRRHESNQMNEHELLNDSLSHDHIKKTTRTENEDKNEN